MVVTHSSHHSDELHGTTVPAILHTEWDSIPRRPIQQQVELTLRILLKIQSPLVNNNNIIF